MKQTDILSRVTPWLKPGLTIVLGLVLLFRPDSVTSAAAWGVGFLVSVIGCGILVAYFFGHDQGFSKLVIGIILMIMGFSVLRDPMALASRMGQFVGILVLLQGIRGYGENATRKTKTISAVFTIVGVILILLPLTASRIVISICGVVILLIGIGILVERLQAQKHPPVKDDIIDSL